MKFVSTIVLSIFTFGFYAVGSVLESDANIEVRAGPTQACGDPRNTLPLLRAYNPSSIDHFYTTDPNEHQIAVSNLGYIDEGTTGYIFSSQQPQSVPLHRLFSAAGGDHVYTTDSAERDKAAANLGYTYEGITGYVYPDSACGALALYRLYSSAGIDHLYTMSAGERDTAVNLGYAQEGTAAYIFPY